MHGNEADEDLILDKMDQVWYELSKEEHELLNSEGPKCWPEDLN